MFPRIVPGPMRRLLPTLFSLAAIGAALYLWLGRAVRKEAAPVTDLMVLGTIHTMDPQRPRAEAALIRGGKLACVGTRSECEKAVAGRARIVEAASWTPGLADAHGHVASYGRALTSVRCGGAKSAEECAARAAERARALPKGAWVRGRGWDQNLWSDGSFPSAAVLTRAVPDHPAILTRVDGHAAWLNERALELAGIRRDTPDPAGGRILRGEGGAPSGVLIDNAVDLALRAVPAATEAEIEEQVLRAAGELVKLGLTSVGDCGVGAAGLAVYRRLAEAGRLPLRVYAMLDGQQPMESLRAQMAAWRATPRVGLLTVRAVKMFADGALGSRGALLFEPYADDAGNSGLRVTAEAELKERIAEVARAGFQPAVHAIGDRACSEVLHAYGSADLKRLRPRVEHLQVLQPRELPLLASSGAIASMQPTHATSDGAWAGKRLGAGTGRASGAYAWRAVLGAGAPLACGSDFPVEEPDPRLGLHAAEARLVDGQPWMPEQRLTRAEALACFTRGVAFAEHAEERRGAIRSGMEADLTGYAADVMAVPAEELPRLRIAATIVAGKLHEWPAR